MIVIGGGIVGLATARALLHRGVRHVLVLEAEQDIATHQTGHNSGVIHSGLYYRPGSSKARNCVSGREGMYRYCDEKGIAYRRCGKLVVATRDEEVPVLHTLRERGVANGLTGLEVLGAEQLRELEPEVEALAGLHVSEAGIVDYRLVATALAEDVRLSGGNVQTGARVSSVTSRSSHHLIQTDSGAVEASAIVNCAGLQCDRVARWCGVDPQVRIVPFRGEYYDLSRQARALVRNPIYPVPDPAFPFLGVHLTPTIHGTVEAGPSAVLAFHREGYSKTDVSLRDLAQTLTYRGFLALARRHWRAGWSEMVRSFSKSRFVEAVKRLVPAIRAEDLTPGKTGVRAQAVDRAGMLLDDFYIVQGARSVHVLNAPSPAATAALSIGEHIAGITIDVGGLQATRGPSTF